jgi:L-seryl-tRNA(Ser) seleniumtransferase
MIAATPPDIRARCDAVASELSSLGVHTSVIESEASIGAGAFPTYGIPSFSVRIAGNPEEIQRRLRSGTMPVIGRIADGFLNLDLRSVPARFDRDLIQSVSTALN